MTDPRALVLELREYAHDEDSAIVTLAERAADALEEQAKEIMTLAESAADALDEQAKEIVAMHEQIAALQSREVCTAAHDNVDECGYCQRDRQQQLIERLTQELAAEREHTSKYVAQFDNDRLRAALLAAKREHDAQCLIRCDPNMQRTYCTCGADAHNLAISNALGEK